MPSWTRSRSPAAPDQDLETERRSAVLVDLEGAAACTHPGCGGSTGLACEYIDRLGRSCRTAWCPEHRLVIGGRVYCRRHAGVVSALPGGYVANASPMPDLENRAPSLVSWVAREVDADIRQLLLSVPAPGEATQLLTDPVYLVFTGGNRRRAWERAWKLVDQTGHTLRVSLLVEECADAEVAVRVNMTIVERVMPPWIAQRLHGDAPPPELDAQRRRDFNRRLLAVIRAGVGLQEGRRGAVATSPEAGDDHELHR